MVCGLTCAENFQQARLSAVVVRTFNVKNEIQPTFSAMSKAGPTVVEICAGAGGQAIGLEAAGYEHEALVEIESDYCKTLLTNRPRWNILHQDVRSFDGTKWRGIDLLAGGVPCPPFSVAGRQLGQEDERDLFPEVIRLADEIRPKAIMIENVRGLLDRRFTQYRLGISGTLGQLGYASSWRLLNARDFGVSQLRPRVVLIAIEHRFADRFYWPAGSLEQPPTIGELLFDLMSENGWEGAKHWAEKATTIAPTLVGGSRKHGGPDLGPTRARLAWKQLGVDGRGIANSAPEPGFIGMPRLTTRMAARVQGFPNEWVFIGGKTSVYRQIGNAFPPPVAQAVGESVMRAVVQTYFRKVV